MNKFYRFLKFLLKPYYKLFYGLRTLGAENEPKDGALIICANHISNHDVFMIAASIKRQISFFAKKELFDNPLTRWFVNGLRAIPVNRGTVDLHSIHASLDVLNAGGTLGIFPQGTRMPNVIPSPDSAKSGVGLLACRSKCNILPIFIDTSRHRTRIFRRVKLIIGEPISYDALAVEKSNMKEYDRVAKTVFTRICQLGGISVGDGNEG